VSGKITTYRLPPKNGKGKKGKERKTKLMQKTDQ